MNDTALLSDPNPPKYAARVELINNRTDGVLEAIYLRLRPGAPTRGERTTPTSLIIFTYNDDGELMGIKIPRSAFPDYPDREILIETLKRTQEELAHIKEKLQLHLRSYPTLSAMEG